MAAQQEIAQQQQHHSETGYLVQEPPSCGMRVEHKVWSATGEDTKWLPRIEEERVLHVSAADEGGRMEQDIEGEMGQDVEGAATDEVESLQLALEEVLCRSACTGRRGGAPGNGVQ